MFKKFIFCIFFWINPALAGEIWNSDEGLKRLEKSQFKNDFYQLVNFYQPQINPVYCSIASSIIVLNALNYGEISSQKSEELIKPNGEVAEYKLFTQRGFLNKETDKIKPREVIDYKAQNKNLKYDPGISLSDLSKILSRTYHLKTTLVSVEKNNQKIVGEFRLTLKKVLSDKTRFLLANFNGEILKQKYSGHFSPLVAYDEESDSVLILDVALHKNQWFWTPISDLISAMNTKDNNNYRGYLLVENR